MLRDNENGRACRPTETMAQAPARKRRTKDGAKSKLRLSASLLSETASILSENEQTKHPLKSTDLASARKRRTTVEVKPFRAPSASLLSENESTCGQMDSKSAVSARKRRTNSPVKSTLPASASLLSENEQATLPSGTNGSTPARKRRAIGLTKPAISLSASPSSGDPGATAARFPAKTTTHLRRSQSSRGVHVQFESHASRDAAGLGDDGALVKLGTHIVSSPVIAEIIQLWRMRQRWHRAEKSLILQGKAICRAFTDGDKTKANELFDQVQSAAGDHDAMLGIALGPFLAGIERFQSERKPIEKRLKALACSLPIHEFVAGIKGFGDLNLAAIVGEAGDVGSYRNPSCLWKRFGLAVIEGQRQRRVLDADLAILMGYAPHRRAVAYLLGDCMIKAGDACRYRPVYTDRKEKFAERAKCKAHSHNDAMRIMVKRVLRDMWVAWRASQTTKPTRAPPAKSSADEAERPAEAVLSPKVKKPGASIPAAAGKRRASRITKPKAFLPAASPSADEAERQARLIATPSDRTPGASISAEAGKRRASPDSGTTTSMPVASSSADEAERPASGSTTTTTCLPGASIPAQAGRRAKQAAQTILFLPAENLGGER